MSHTPLARSSRHSLALLQEASVPQELLQETILLQEVLLTAHMARAYEFPTLVRHMLPVYRLHLAKPMLSKIYIDLKRLCACAAPMLSICNVN